MKKPCKFNPNKCGCRNLHVMETCEMEAKGETCIPDRDIKVNLRHAMGTAHRLKCDAQEWLQRMTVVELAKAHNDGRYR